MMNHPAVEKLLQDLKNPEEKVRTNATHQLWQIWFQQKGAYGLEFLQQAQALLELGKIPEAEAILNELIQDQPSMEPTSGAVLQSGQISKSHQRL